MADEHTMPERRRLEYPRRRARAEDIDLTDEDHHLLDSIHDQLAADERVRRERYAPIMRKLVAGLRAIDAEAVPLPSGVPIGLRWYAYHRRRDEANPKNFRNEEDWSRRLKELLAIENIPAVTEKRYPKPPVRKCDLVIQWPEIGELWLEVKGAWRHMDSMGRRKNRSFEKHLSAAGMDLKKLLTLDETAVAPTPPGRNRVARPSDSYSLH